MPNYDVPNLGEVIVQALIIWGLLSWAAINLIHWLANRLDD